MFVLVFFGCYGLHRFYIEDIKAGAIIFLISILGVIGIIFQIQFHEYLLAIIATIFLFESLTFIPRLNRYNDQLSKHYL